MTLYIILGIVLGLFFGYLITIIADKIEKLIDEKKERRREFEYIKMKTHDNIRDIDTLERDVDFLFAQLSKINEEQGMKVVKCETCNRPMVLWAENETEFKYFCRKCKSIKKIKKE